MGLGSWWHWLVVLAVVLLLFGGKGKIPNLMKDLGQGINAFKKGLKDSTKDGEPTQQAESNDKQHSAIDRS